MKRLTFLLVLLTSMGAVADIPGFLTQEKRTWNFIQSVGGMKVTAKGKKLIVHCDVSGVSQVTVKPTMVNSALGVRKVKVKREGNKLFLTVVTSLIGKGVGPVPKPVDLSASPDGVYQVFYLDPNGAKTPLGRISLRGREGGQK